MRSGVVSGSAMEGHQRRPHPQGTHHRQQTYSSGSAGHHVRNQLSYQSNHLNNATNIHNMAPISQHHLSGEAGANSRENTSSTKKQNSRRSRLSQPGSHDLGPGPSVNAIALNLFNSSLKSTKKEIPEAAGLSKQATSQFQVAEHRREAADQAELRPVGDVIGGDGFSPINGEAKLNEARESDTRAGVSQSRGANAPPAKDIKSTDEASAKRQQQMRQMKNLQNLQRSGQSRKKSTQFGKSNNKVLLMSGTKTQMLEITQAAQEITKAEGSVGGEVQGVPQGTATLIELRAVNRAGADYNSTTPDLMNQTDKSASHPNNPLRPKKLTSKSFAKDQHHMQHSVSDYGGGGTADIGKVKDATQQQQQPAALMMLTLSDDLQAPDDVPMISVFDQAEELQFMSYELGTKLRSLLETILHHSVEDQDYMHKETLLVQSDAWDSIQNVAKEASSDFELIQESLRSFFDRMQDEVAKWKRRCTKLQTRLQSVVMPPLPAGPSKRTVPMGMSRSQGKHAGVGTVADGSGRITIQGNGGRKGLVTQSASLNHSGAIQSKKERLMLQKSLIEIVNVYDKNRTQIYSNLEEMESRVNEFKNTREKLNVQHLGTMTTVEQEMEQMCLRSARSHKSNGMKSQRSHSASKRPMASLEASRRSSRASIAGQDNNTQPKSIAPGAGGIVNTPKILSSGSKASKQRVNSVDVTRTPEDQRAGGAGGAVRSSASLVPPLPIHMISNLRDKEQKKKAPQQQTQQNSARSAHSKPPPPESYRSARSQGRQNRAHNISGRNSARDSARGGGGISARNQNGATGGNGDSQRSRKSALGPESVVNSSQQNITGAIVNGALVNQVMLQANNKIATSKFDRDLETSYEGGEATLLFDTERLKQFPEDYACLTALESTDQKILVKQLLFMRHERELKAQAKVEKEAKQKRRAEERAAGGKASNTRNGQRRQNSLNNSNNPSQRSGGGASGAQRQHARHGSKDVELGHLLDISAIQLESSLSQIGTIEKLKARAGEGKLEAQLSEMLAVSQNISGLKTVTQKELVQLAEKQWAAQEQIRAENRRNWEWENGEEDDDQDLNNRDNRILGDISVEQPHRDSDAPVSPSQIQMNLQDNQLKAHQPMLKSFKNSPRERDDLADSGMSPIRPNPDHSSAHLIGMGPDPSFINDDSSSMVEDSSRLEADNRHTPPSQDNQARIRAGDRGLNIGEAIRPSQGYSAQMYQQQMEQNRHPNLGYDQGGIDPLKPGQSRSAVKDFNHGGVAVPIDSSDTIITDHNALANATSNSGDESLLFAQKKSLEVITERQSEFSNTMGTFARPSQRSKQSKNHSSNAKNVTRGHQSALVASQASLSSAHINSSRHYAKNPSGSKNNAGQNQPHVASSHAEKVANFVDITDQEIGPGSRYPFYEESRRPSIGGVKVETNAAQGYLQEASVQPSGDQQFTDMASITPLRLPNVPLEPTNEQTEIRKLVRQSSGQSTSTVQQNVTRQQIAAYQHLMYELKVNSQGVAAAQFEAEGGETPATVLAQPRRQERVTGTPSPHAVETPGQERGQVMSHLRARQKQVADLQTESIHSSYVDNSCYMGDETSSILQSSSAADHGPSGSSGPSSSLKKHRRQRNPIGGSQSKKNQAALMPRPDETPSLKRSNSEVYIKDTSMQNEQDAFFVPIMYALEASQSLQQSAEGGGRVRIDQSQLNNLTRYLEVNNSANRFGDGPDSNGTFQINNTLYQQLQRLFMQHQTQRTAIQDLTTLAGQNNNSLRLALSKSVGKATGRHTVDQPSILKPSQGGFSITGLLNESLTLPHLQKRTLQMLYHLQNYQNHNFNPAVGLLFSGTASAQQQALQAKSQERPRRASLQPGDEPRGFSQSSVDRGVSNTALFVAKKDSSPIADRLSNILLDRTEVKALLLEGYPPVRQAAPTTHTAPNKTAKTNAKYRSEAAKGVSLPANHHNPQSQNTRETVSQYVQQVKKPNNKLSRASAQGVQSASVVKTAARASQSAALQKSLMAYQSTDMSRETKPAQSNSMLGSSDYVDQSFASHAVGLGSAGGVPKSQLSMISRSVERGGDSSVSSAAIQKKLRLKTNKQFKFIAERQSHGLKPRPASSLAPTSLNRSAVTSAQGNAPQISNFATVRQGSSESRQNPGDMSTISAKPTLTKFKILQVNQSAASAATRDQSAGSRASAKQQLASQPQFTKHQQMQIKLQKQNLVSQMTTYGGATAQGASGSGSKLEGGQKVPILKRTNIKKLQAGGQGSAVNRGAVRN